MDIAIRGVMTMIQYCNAMVEFYALWKIGKKLCSKSSDRESTESASSRVKRLRTQQYSDVTRTLRHSPINELR